MSLIAEFRLGLQVMQETTRAFPGIEYQQEEVHLTDTGAVNSIVWVTCDDFGAFESELDTDSDVTDFELLTDLQSRRLYRVTIAKEATERVLYPKAVESDIVYLDVTGTAEGTHFRVRAPSVEAIQTLQQVCHEQGISFRLHRLYQEKPDDPATQFGLTTPQSEVLIRAHERGYFEQPRCVTLEELADEFDVSSSALGRRMRRGLNVLISQALRSSISEADDQ